MKVQKIVSASGDELPFYFGGDSAHITNWPKNPDGQDLLLLFSINCKAAKQRLGRTDLPEDGVIHVFSTYDQDDYFLDSITVDELQLQRGAASYTYVVHSEGVDSIKSPRPSIPLQTADFEEVSIDEGELIVSSLMSLTAPAGALIPRDLAANYNFLCQVYSSDFPSPFQDVLYMSDGVGYLLISKKFGGEDVDGCFFVQVA
ncbi:DUF1963 domain-containing protein [Pseudomonas sp. NY15354]|uniref:DUF1963 domain-containing protein n=1 Tax=Pseudomonas sp. NY15354 TaxID=3400351 RepID=UPI003A85A20A